MLESNVWNPSESQNTIYMYDKVSDQPIISVHKMDESESGHMVMEKMTGETTEVHTLRQKEKTRIKRRKREKERRRGKEREKASEKN